MLGPTCNTGETNLQKPAQPSQPNSVIFPVGVLFNAETGGGAILTSMALFATSLPG